MSNSLSARVQLQGNLHAARGDLLLGVMVERGNRGFASDREAWAELALKMEVLESRLKDLRKVHKEMWDAVREDNGDAFCALANELERSAGILAEECVMACVMGKIAVEFTGE